MARVELPASRNKARKRRRLLRVCGVLGASLVAAAAALVAASHIPHTLVDTVVVSGVETVASSTVRKEAEAHLQGYYGYLLPKRNIFLYPKQDIARAVAEAHPVFASVDVHAVDFHTIAINVVERHPRALWCEEACYFLDEHGVVYAPAPIFSEPIYISYLGPVTGGRMPYQYLTPTTFQALAALVDAVAQRLPEEEVERVSVDAAGDVRVRFSSGFVLMFALSDEGGDVFERFALSLKAEPFSGRALAEFEYLDLRFGDKLYYKEKSE